MKMKFDLKMITGHPFFLRKVSVLTKIEQTGDAGQSTSAANVGKSCLHRQKFAHIFVFMVYLIII